MKSDEEMAILVAIEATALFAEGIADSIGESVQVILDHPAPSPEYKKGYGNCVEDVQRLLRSAADQQRAKINQTTSE